MDSRPHGSPLLSLGERVLKCQLMLVQLGLGSLDTEMVAGRLWVSGVAYKDRHGR